MDNEPVPLMLRHLNRGSAAFLMLLLVVACGRPQPEQGPPPAGRSDSTPDVSLALLSEVDLPPEWREEPQTESLGVGEEDTGFCDEPVPDRAGGTASAVVQFTKDDTVHLVETIVSHADVGDATAAFDKLEQLAGDCREWDVEEQGVVIRFAQNAATFPNIGDETIALRLEGQVQLPGSRQAPSLNGSVVADMVMVRYESWILVLRHFTIGPTGTLQLNSAETEPIARRAADKMIQQEAAA